MTVDASLKILVIILATTLALFLVLAIIVMINLIQVAAALKRISRKAEEIADKAEAVTDFFDRASTPMALGRFLSNIAETVSKHKRGK